MNAAVRRSLVTGDVEPINNEAFTEFQVASTEYVEILPEARPKISKIMFTSANNNRIAIVDRTVCHSGCFDSIKQSKS